MALSYAPPSTIATNPPYSCLLLLQGPYVPVCFQKWSCSLAAELEIEITSHKLSYCVHDQFPSLRWVVDFNPGVRQITLYDMDGRSLGDGLRMIRGKTDFKRVNTLTSSSSSPSAQETLCRFRFLPPPGVVILLQ